MNTYFICNITTLIFALINSIIAIFNEEFSGAGAWALVVFYATCDACQNYQKNDL